MNSSNKSLLFLLFLCIFLCAGSAALNLFQFQQAQGVLLKKVREDLPLRVLDIKRTGRIVQNNPDEKWIVVVYENRDGQPEQMKVWVTSEALIVRTHTTVVSTIIEGVSVEDLKQKDLQVGEPVYITGSNSIDRKRLETKRIVAGELLPLSR